MIIAQKEQKDRFVKMTAKRIKKMIAEDVHIQKFFDGKIDLKAEAEKIVQFARELLGRDMKQNTRTESINKTDFPDDFILTEFHRQTGMRVSSIEVFEEITQEEYHAENGFGIRFNYKFREPVTRYKFTIPIPEEVQV